MTDRDRAIFVAEAGIENRKSTRLETRFDVEYTSRSAAGQGRTINVSASGALIGDPDPPLPAGAELRLRFSLFEGAIPISVHGEVVRSGETQFAVEFIEMNPRTRKVLKTAIAKALRERRKRNGAG